MCTTQIRQLGEVRGQLLEQSRLRQSLAAQLEDVQSKVATAQQEHDRNNRLLQEKSAKATDSRPLQQLTDTLKTLRVNGKPLLAPAHRG